MDLIDFERELQVVQTAWFFLGFIAGATFAGIVWLIVHENMKAG